MPVNVLSIVLNIVLRNVLGDEFECPYMNVVLIFYRRLVHKRSPLAILSVVVVGVIQNGR